MINQTDTIGITSSFMLGELKVDAKHNTVTRETTVFSVEPRLMRVIVKLSQSAGDVVGRADLLSEISDHAYVNDESLTQAISKIRQAFGDTSRQPRFIKTIPRKGYVLLVQPTLTRHDELDDETKARHSTQSAKTLTNWVSSHLKILIVILCLNIIATAAVAFWWSSDTEFIEEGAVEFIEKEK